MDVRHHMTRNPLTVHPTDSLRKAWLLMQQGGFSRLPVVEDHRVIGIISARDIWERAPAGVVDSGGPDRDYLMDHLRVMGIMTLQPVAVAPTMPIAEAARLLRERKLGALLVVEGGELLGIITKGDVIDALITAKATAPQSSALQSFDTARTS
jgi:acetoin utilization protein AcuB